MAYTKNIYALPFSKKDFVDAMSDPLAHPKPIQHAIDFGLPEGTAIKASKAGIVVCVKVDSNEGGTAKKYQDIYKYLNQIAIKHKNNEVSDYAHLKHNSALVKLGDKVRQGQPIALSGNTGYSTEPHLHFMVFKTAKNYLNIRSLKIRFKQKIKVIRPKRSKKEIEKVVSQLKQQVKNSKKQLETPKQKAIKQPMQNTKRRTDE